MINFVVYALIVKHGIWTELLILLITKSWACENWCHYLKFRLCHVNDLCFMNFILYTCLCVYICVYVHICMYRLPMRTCTHYIYLQLTCTIHVWKNKLIKKNKGSEDKRDK